MKTLTLRYLLFSLFSLLTIQVVNGQGTTQVQVNPDCSVVNATVTVTGSATITLPAGNGFDNRLTACQSYVLEYTATATSGSLTSIAFQAASGAVTPGSFANWGGTVSTGVNPNTSSVAGITTFTTGCAASTACTVANAWLHVLITPNTFIGTIKLTVYGWKAGAVRAGGGGGGTGCIPAGLIGVLQANNGSGACQATSITDNGTTINATEPITISGVAVLKSAASGIQSWLTTPSSANLAAALTDKTGTGTAVFANGPTLIAPILGTPASGNASNLMNLPIVLTTTGTSGAATYTQSTNTLNVPQYTGGGGTGCIPTGSAGVLQAGNGSGACEGTLATDSGTALTYTGAGGIVATGGFTSGSGSPAKPTGGTGGAYVFGAGTPPTNYPAAGASVLYADSFNGLEVSNNLGAFAPVLFSGAAGIESWLLTPSGSNLASALTTPLTVAGGGLGLASGTSGGVPCYTGSTTIASSAAGTINDLMLWGGAGACPADAGFLGSNVVRKDTTNAGAAAMTLDMSASTSAAAFRLPNIAGASSTTNGVGSYDTTNKNIHVGSNGVDNILALFPSGTIPTNGDCPKWVVTLNVVTLSPSDACGGGSSSLTIGTTAISGGATNAVLYGDGTVLQNASGVTRTGVGFFTHTINALGTTPSDAIEVVNTTAAASGAQQISPSIHWSGQGWETGTGASQPTDFKSYVLPVQSSSSSPTATWVLASSINSGAYVNALTVSNTGTVLASGTVTCTGNCLSTTGTFGAAFGSNITIQANNNSAAAGTGITLTNASSVTNSTGLWKAASITQTYNQTSTASATDLLINRTETAVGSGAQYFQDWQVGGTSKGHLDHLGILTLPNLAATNTGDVNLCWTTTGTFTQGAVCGSSLLAHKNNIVALEHGLDYVMQMRPVTYNRIATGTRELGMIADWTASIDPLLGAYDKAGDLQNFRDRAVMTVMIRAIQEQQAQIDVLKEQNRELQGLVK